ncbi:VOC family protein [Alkalibacillus haloalkaliphilus]|uniref:Catechol-2,3-dioxygenase n=1 Tax=Alkalibacillus haloalkaliphilus TaxID=94136 RepID=A0A511W3W2_9BACI|nr:VOC family protein [Alkalibacillus haloalkaliphilus]GEN45451.1 catechol-2,3-dioxygenase [Alkalibacillus haloalkaliphilus]
MNFHSKPTTFVSRVTIKVTDLARSLEFYQKIVGLNVLEQTEGTAHLTADGKTSMLKLVQPENPEPKQRRTSGLYHFAILVPERRHLADFVIHLSEHKVPIGASDHLVSDAIYFNDPDGNGIEVYQDKDPDTWTWQGDQVEMAVDPLDFEDLVKYKTDQGWQGMPEKTVMGHIHLHVSDLRQAEKFYVDGLGFDVVCQFGGQAIFLSTNGYHHHIAANTWNGVGAPKASENSAGLHSYQIVYPDEASRDTVIHRLKDMGSPVEGNVTEDPAGNQIELVV